MKIKNKSLSDKSKKWLKRHLKDEFVKKSKLEKYRSRAAYKLLEIDKKYNLLKSCNSAIDLGAAPGSWSEVLLEKLNSPQKIIAIDLLEVKPLKNVEIIKGDKTNNSIVKRTLDYVSSIGKIAVECNDSPGFVSNRILMPMINEAIFCLEQDVAEKEAIDDIMKLGMAHPMGPLELADFIGLDVCLDIMNVLRVGFNDSKYRPCILLKKMVSSGLLGKKSGRGFYTYD